MTIRLVTFLYNPANNYDNNSNDIDISNDDNCGYKVNNSDNSSDTKSKSNHHTYINSHDKRGKRSNNDNNNEIYKNNDL